MAAAYCNLGNAYQRLGDLEEALECHNQHLSVAKELGIKRGEAAALASLGTYYRRLGNFKQAIEYHKQGLSIVKSLGDRSEEGGAYGDLGNDYQNLGDFQQAIEYHQKRLGIAKDLGDRAGEGAAYGNLGNDYQKMGHFKQAMHYHKQHLSIAKELGQRDGEGRAYGNLGNSYQRLGDFKVAIEYHNKHLSVAKELGQKADEGDAYSNLGNDYLSLGEFKQSIQYHKRHLDIVQELGNTAREGAAYANLGNAHHSLGEFEEAIEYGEQELKISKEVGDRAAEGSAYGRLGTCFQSLGKFQEAIEYHKQELDIAREVGDRDGEGSAYGNLGTAYQSLGDFKQSIAYHKQALCIAQELGQRVDEGRGRFSLGQLFEFSGALRDALDYYRSSVKLFNEARALLQSEDVWKISFRNKCHYTYTALWRTLLKLQKYDAALCVAEQGRGQALKDLMKLQYESELQAAQTFEAEEISDMLSHISKQTVFVALESCTIYLWVICKGGRVHLRQKEVDKEDAVATLKSLRENALKEIRGSGPVRCENRSLRDDDVSTSEGTAQETVPTSEFKTDSLRLFHDFIVGPIVDLLEGDELLIVPDGPLCLTPFAAFLDGDSKRLFETVRIRILPSLMSLKLITDCPEDYHAISGVLLVGDPYVKEVKRVRGKKVQLEQLSCALEEVKKIGKILNTEPLTGRDATKEEVLQRISSVALVHIAAHDDMENGEIALAPNPTRPSKVPKDVDFLLKMSDIQSVKLRAKLVVLSCCHSAQGKVSAEGVVGIARAFLGAGARSVVVSLWAIDDEATMEFMKSFYQHLSSGDSANVALNRTMKCLRESEKFGAVKYWAPFLLIGDDVTIKFEEDQ